MSSINLLSSNLCLDTAMDVEEVVQVLKKNEMELPSQVPTMSVFVPEHVSSLRGINVVADGSTLFVVGGRSTRRSEDSNVSVVSLTAPRLRSHHHGALGVSQTSGLNDSRALAIDEEEDDSIHFADSYIHAQKNVDAHRINVGGALTSDGRHSTSTVLDGDTLYVFGGLGFVHSLHGIVWDQVLYAVSKHDLTVTDLTATIPASSKSIRRRGHSAVLLDHIMYVYGGWGTRCDHWVRVTETYNTQTQRWGTARALRGTFPPGVSHHSAVVHNGTMIVFGGFMDVSVTRQRQEIINKGVVRNLHSHRVVCADTNSRSASGSAGFHVPCRCDVVGATASYQPHAGESSETLIVGNSTYTYCIEMREWRQRQCTGEVPEPRAHHACLMYEGWMVMCGGEAEAVYDDVFMLEVRMFVWTKIDFSPAPRAMTGHGVCAYNGHMFVLGGSGTTAYYDPTVIHNENDVSSILSSSALRSSTMRRRSAVPQSEVMPLSRMLAYAKVKFHLVMSQLKADDGGVKPKLVLRSLSQIEHNSTKLSITKLVTVDPPLANSSASTLSKQRSTGVPSPHSSFRRSLSPTQTKKLTERLYDPGFIDNRSKKLSRTYTNLALPPPHGSSNLERHADRFYERPLKIYKDKSDKRFAALSGIAKKHTMAPEEVEQSVHRLYAEGMRHESKLADKLQGKYFHGDRTSLDSQAPKQHLKPSEIKAVVERLTKQEQERRAAAKLQLRHQYVEMPERSVVSPKLTEEERDAVHQTLYEKRKK
eukprot:PhM_4_TR7609/c0_g1_i1/m.44883